MHASNTHDTDRDAPDDEQRDLLERGRARASSLLGRGRTGTIAMLAGGALLVRALRANTRGRGAVQAIAGVGLLVLGVQQRLARGNEFDADRPTARTEEPPGASSGVDTAARTAHAVESKTNPRDVTQESEVETKTGPDEGSVQFTTDHEEEPRSKPESDEGAEGETDPRHPDEEGVTEVDLSKTAMADEPNEALGPQPEQAEPASTEGTEPEPNPPEDASHMRADEPATDVHGEDDREREGASEPSDEGEETEDGGGEAVSTDDRYEGERGDDGTVDDEDGTGT